MLLQAMKLDSESPYHHHCPHEDATKGTVRNDSSLIFAKDNHFMIDMFDVDKESLKVGKHVLPLPSEGRKNSKATDPHKQYLNIQDFIDSDKSDKSDGECMEAPYFAPASNFEIVVKEDFYTDKIVTKAGLPETKVCIEHNPSCIVKDISIDEGVQPSCKSLVEKEEGDTVESSISNPIIKDGHNDSTCKIADSSGSDYLKYTLFDSPVTVVVKDQADSASVLQNDSAMNDSSICSTNREGNKYTAESLVSSEVTEKSVVSASHNNTTESLVSVNNCCDRKCASVSSVDGKDKLDTDESVVLNISAEGTECQLSQVDSTCNIFSNDQKQSVNRQKFRAISEDGNSAHTALVLRSEGSASTNESVEIPANCKVPNEVITFNFDTEEVSTSGKNENKEVMACQKSEVIQSLQTGHGTVDAMIDSASTSARSSFRHLIQRESNLSGPDMLSGPIVNSGHILYSGSISFRSESSTTSTRSFAFPILQSEWNSSPVKMAKANRRKNRGWRMGLLCCRF